MSKPATWKKGRGKLGVFAPLLGSWVVETDSDLGLVRCTREFTKILDGKFIQLQADWTFGDSDTPRSYSEICMFGTGDDKTLHFWSYTSDGKRSDGWISTADDIHPQALCFEADMPSGRARQTYWPSEDGVKWAVENQTKKGWNRFLEHNYVTLLN